MGEILVAGGGIGGLVAALSLQAAGFTPRVFEAVAEYRPLGVGINVLPHAVRELTELGLAEPLAATGIATRELRYISAHGQEIWREDRGLAAGYRWPQYSIHRGMLQMLLVEECRARGIPLHTGHRVTRFAQDGDGVTAHFDNGAEARGAALIGADGIHSAIRRHFAPDEGAPSWQGAVLWRATTVAPPFLTGATMVQAGHHDQKFVCYPIRHLPDGQVLTNWIAEMRMPVEQGFNREDWNREADRNSFLPHYESWNWGWLDVPGLIRGAERVLEYPMVDRDPLERWSEGRVTLLGDAAHPMYPIGSNGASQAILDARQLALHLARAGDIAEGLARYEAARLPPTAKLTLANRALGPDLILEEVHRRAPQGFNDLHAVISERELTETASNYKRLAGFDPALLNERESWSV
ncbi:flavin-dependent oxidoreductase [Sediminicoccus sp. KRV36]|uniref:flavin-dependent oxidoreductase n=1 Tax=Sediminicoccus sp. KRV36 TaxID=3133721 RepID=UPI0020108E42|nr:flavin-dependent oxidoreductase [Sediminicoccus rosea]UPY38554.1 flavin-dependent oxidoreductase [Sediminicoccus rosea]